MNHSRLAQVFLIFLPLSQVWYVTSYQFGMGFQASEDSIDTLNIELVQGAVLSADALEE
jgi:hypothetical protein